MPTAIEKYQSLVQKLFQNTNSKNLSWTHADDNPRYIEIRIANRYLSVAESENENGDPLIVVTIYDDDNNPVEKFDDEDIRGNPVEYYEGKTYYQLLLSIFNMGRRQSTGADEAIDDILLELDKMVPF